VEGCRRGRLTQELLSAVVPDLASRRVHVCGPVSMMDTTKAILAEIGVQPHNLKSEQFGAVKPAPVAPGSSVKRSPPATGPLVTFSRSNKSRSIRENQTILELSEELGIGIDFSCRIGTCGICKLKMTAGEVDMAVQDSLDEEDKQRGIILACQAKPKTQVMVEA
jgi:glycine betaine catabolism B